MIVSASSRNHVANVNEAFTLLNESVIPFGKRKTESYLKKKVETVSQNLKNTLGVASDPELDIAVSLNDGLDVITRLKEKYHQTSTTKDKKRQILTILPLSWSIKKSCEVTGSTEHMAKKTKNVIKKSGILSTAVSKPR